METETLSALILCFGFIFSTYINVEAKPQVPCYFIFGDSLSDSGNNNLLFTLAKANYPPYGIDFPGGTTGRFTNGETVVDVLARLLGLPYIQSYSDIFANASLGINYASGDSGIRIESGGLTGQVLNLDLQLKNHKCIVNRLSLIHDRKYLNKCLYTVTTGSNDYANNYYGVGYLTSLFYTPQTYAVDLINRYRDFLKSLYAYGARKVAVFGLGYLGCIPIQVQVHGVTKGSTCFEDENKAVELFNTGLIALVNQLNANYADAKFTYINYRGIFPKPFSQGLKVCCPVIDGAGLCRFLGTPCENRSEYIYWDEYHPTAAANAVIGKRAYVAEQPTDAYPVDISHLVKI